jgi:23S rRNA (pseudouridine1915-N3)-methyltransferase
MISIVAIGKKHEDWIVEGLERYQKRLRQPFDVQWHLLPHSALQEQAARQEESARILGRISDNAFVILLDETGTSLSSPAFAELLERQHSYGVSVVVIIGGAYGVDKTIHDRADLVLSLSRLVFPHQLVRLILMEQLYRAQEIARGGKYHHG